VASVTAEGLDLAHSRDLSGRIAHAGSGARFLGLLAVRALHTIRFPRLIRAAGYADGMQINTIEPAPASEASRGPRLVLSYDDHVIKILTYPAWRGPRSPP
jgi:hypothetical protein